MTLLKNLVLVMAIAFILALSVSRCSPVRAGGGPSVERVFSTEVAYTCFLIRDDEGKGVGGNCVKD